MRLTKQEKAGRRDTERTRESTEEKAQSRRRTQTTPAREIRATRSEVRTGRTLIVVECAADRGNSQVALARAQVAGGAASGRRAGEQRAMQAD